MIRPYGAADRASVREIVRVGAHRGMGTDALFEDRELCADYLTSYYTDTAPELLLVAEEDRRVVGCVLGCADTRRYVRVMGVKIVPRVLGVACWRLAHGRYRSPTSARFLQWVARQSWRESPPIDVARYPGHFHISLAPGAREPALAPSLWLAFAQRLAARGAERFHVRITERRGRGGWRRIMDEDARRAGAPLFEFVSERTCTMYRDVMGDGRPFVNHAYGFRVDRFIDAIEGYARARGIRLTRRVD